MSQKSAGKKSKPKVSARERLLRTATALFARSGYDGTTVVMLKPTDIATINKLPDVAAQLMRQAGFKVDVQAMDWQTMVGRRSKKDPVDKGGWNMFFTAVVAPDTWNPIANFGLSGACDKAWFGWACDATLEEIRARFARSTDDGEQKKLAAEVQARGF